MVPSCVLSAWGKASGSAGGDDAHGAGVAVAGVVDAERGRDASEESTWRSWVAVAIAALEMERIQRKADRRSRHGRRQKEA